MYHATLERSNGKIETVNGILKWDVKGDFFYLNGTDFEIFISAAHYSMVDIQEGSL